MGFFVFVEWPAYYYNKKIYLLNRVVEPIKNNRLVFLIKKTDDDDQNFEILVSNK